MPVAIITRALSHQLNRFFLVRTFKSRSCASALFTIFLKSAFVTTLAFIGISLAITFPQGVSRKLNVYDFFVFVVTAVIVAAVAVAAVVVLVVSAVVIIVEAVVVELAVEVAAIVVLEVVVIAVVAAVAVGVAAVEIVVEAAAAAACDIGPKTINLLAMSPDMVSGALLLLLGVPLVCCGVCRTMDDVNRLTGFISPVDCGDP
jgi:hypothetical protein